MGAKISYEMLRAIELIKRLDISPYAAVKELAKEGLVITEQAICQSRLYKELKKNKQQK